MSMNPIPAFITVFQAFSDATGYSERTCSRLVLNAGHRFESIEAGSRVSFQVLETAIAKMSELWPDEAEWPEDVWPRPAKKAKKQTDLALAR